MMRRTFQKRCCLFQVPQPTIEPIFSFAPGTPEREKFLEAVSRVNEKKWDIPCVVGGQEFRKGSARVREVPHDRHRVACKYYYADEDIMKKAISASLESREKWSQMPFRDRAAICLRAAHLISTTYRYDILAATMIGQSKNMYQAEIDATCESIDFLRFGVKFAHDIYSQQPECPPDVSVWNFMDYRPLEGFVFAISPFNFTAIGVNLCTAPALMGNTVVWKPSDASVLANYIYYQILQEAGMPDGVVNFCPTSPQVANDVVISNPNLGGVAFTGSTATFRKIWKGIANNLEHYRSFPRIVGECGGKNFHLVHPTAFIDETVAGTVRSAFEFNGQKCSACSRLYLPKSLKDKFIPKLIQETQKIVMDDPEKPQTFLGAVIDEAAFNRIQSYVDLAKNDPSCKIIQGGVCDSTKGWFVSPTIIETTDPNHRIMTEEIFGPVLSVYYYEDSQWEETIKLVDASPYSLTGAIYCNDRSVVVKCVEESLRESAGNLYINDKSTGSVVSQQPFGGSRGSGTNDKAGFSNFLQRWISPRTIKENFNRSTAITYPHQQS